MPGGCKIRSILVRRGKKGLFTDTSGAVCLLEEGETKPLLSTSHAEWHTFIRIQVI
jgi:hypothetical protein